MKDKVIIIGAGPAGLFCSYKLLKNGFQVDLYDQMSGPAKKFLVAGNGGLNLTHSEDLKIFSEKYGKNQDFFYQLINEFSPSNLREFCAELGVETFIGTSGRIFPKKLNAAEILINWLSFLKSHDNFNLFLKHKFVQLKDNNTAVFTSEETQKEVCSKYIIMALGGASWKKTGSDGVWYNILKEKKIPLSPFLPMNCGFECTWGEHFVKSVHRHALKNIKIKLAGTDCDFVRGEIMLTPFGMEGGAIYALSYQIRDEIISHKTAKILIDLKPDLELDDIILKLKQKSKKVSLSNYLRKSLGLEKAAKILLYEILDKDKLSDMEYLARNIKSLEVEFHSPRPIDEAISTSGGVKFTGLNDNLELKEHQGLFFVGEMLDFEAPTGGYLLQACFSTAYRAVQSIISSSAKSYKKT